MTLLYSLVLSVLLVLDISGIGHILHIIVASTSDYFTNITFHHFSYSVDSGANFTKGLKLSLFIGLSQGLKSKTLVLARSET